MAAPAIPSNLIVQQANRQVWLTWDLTATALTYDVQRSLDNITYSTIATVAINNYLDTAVTAGTEYFYRIDAINGDGPSSFTSPLSTIPTPTAEMSLGQIRLAAQQRADRVNSQFVTLPEWNSYIRQSLYELYDLLITAYQDYYIATPAQFTTNGTTYLYPLPDGLISFTNGISGTPGLIAAPFYKLIGVDLNLNFTNNAWVTLDKFNFIDRNRFIYPTSGGSILGVFNPLYRLMGSNIEFIPTPTASVPIRLWYIPRLPELLKDTDLTSSGISGWIEYVIVDAAIKALQKEESDVSVLMMQKQGLIKRIEESAINRDAGRPDTISQTRRVTNGGWNDGWGSGPIGGF